MAARAVLEAIERFEGEENLKGFLDELSQGCTSLKYAYIGPAAFTHDELAKRDGYKSNVDATSVESRLLARFGIPDRVEIGPGNALHSLQVFDELPAAHRPRRTLLLDFSQALLSLCLARMIARGVPELSQAQWDFESGPTSAVREWRDSLAQPLLAMVIGHTLGNPADVLSVLRNIGHSLEPADRLLVSIALRTDVDPLPNYRTPEFFMAATEPFRMIGLGLEPSRLQLAIGPSGSVLAHVDLTASEIALIEDVFGVMARSRVRCFESRRLFAELGRDVADDRSHAGFVFVRGDR